MSLNTLKSYQINTEEELNALLNTKELVLYQEVKSIPNQVLGLKLSVQDKCFHLEEDNPYNETIGYQIRYKLEEGVSGVWRFARKYGLMLKKNLVTNYGINEILYIKEPFIVDDKDELHYKFNSKKDSIKFTHQRYMKQEQSRYFIQINNIKIDKQENFYLDNINFQTEEDMRSNMGNLSFLRFKNEDTIRKEPRKLKQMLYSHKYTIKYTCKLIKNPFLAKVVPSSKIRYFYRLQIPSLNQFSESSGYMSWDDFEMGYIEATTKKEARALLEDEFDTKITMRFTKKEDMGTKYQYLLKIFPPDEYWDEHWGGERECDICGTKFTLIDRNNKGEYRGNSSCCCSECGSVANSNQRKIAEEEKIFKTMEENNGIHNPCIYKITNKNNKKVYIGQTTQLHMLEYPDTSAVSDRTA